MSQSWRKHHWCTYFWTFLYCSPFIYRFTNIEITKFIALNLFASVLFLYFASFHGFLMYFSLQILLFQDVASQWRAQDLFQQGQKKNQGWQTRARRARNFFLPPLFLFLPPPAEFNSAPGAEETRGQGRKPYYTQKKREKHFMIDHSAIPN